MTVKKTKISVRSWLDKFFEIIISDTGLVKYKTTFTIRLVKRCYDREPSALFGFGQWFTTSCSGASRVWLYL